MQMSIALLTLFWLRNLPTVSAAASPTNETAESLTSKSHTPLQPPTDLRPNAVQVIDYPIPGTTTVIHFILGPPLPPAAMQNTILSAYSHITSVIASHGDAMLPASKDPFVYNRGYGAVIRAHSTHGRHLTWSLLEGAVVGLYNGLYLTGFYRASEFRISDGVLGWVGVGEMGAEFVGAGGGGGRNGTVGWRGVRDVGKGNGDGNNDGNVTMSEMLETS